MRYVFAFVIAALAAPSMALAAPPDTVAVMDTIPVGFQVVPGLGTPGDRHVRFASFNLLASRNFAVDGLEMGMVNLVDDRLSGLQMGLWNQVGRHVSGLQLGVVANWASGTVEGLQMAYGFNIAGDTSGAQLSSVFNLARDLDGVQASTGVNLGRDVTGVQLSLGANVAKNLEGVQWTVGGNYAESFEGVQLGLVNVTKNGKGFMLGLVNVADALDGEALGLINVIKDGYQHVEVFTSDTDAVAVGVKLGGKSFYTVFQAGWSPYAGEDQDRVSIAFGLGGHISLAPRLGLDIDVIFSGRFDPDTVLDIGFEPVAMAKLRVALGYQFFDHLGIFAGVTLNNAVTWQPGKRRMASYDMGTVGSNLVPKNKFNGEGAVWPGFVLGVRL